MLYVASPYKTSAIFCDANAKISVFSTLIEPFAQGKYTL